MPESTTTRCVGDEPLPGYRLVAPLGRGGFGEVWQCLAPGGLAKAIKFVAEDAASRAEGRTPLRTEYEAFLRVKGIRHPFLLQLERVELVGGELLMVMELADGSLVTRFDECRRAGRPGVPRAELLSYMVDAAEALDVLSRQHQLQHLDVKPANLFLVGGHVKVGDYGLVAHFARGGPTPGRLGRGLTPRYVAPEVLANEVDPRSDQYTLALVYLELLTGSYPYDGTTVPEVLRQHAHAAPDLAAAPAGDRAALRRALAKRPAGRYPSCLEFVKALMADTGGPATPPPVVAPPPRRPAPAALEATVPAGGLGATLSTTLRGTPALYGPAAATGRAAPAAPESHCAFPGYRLAEDLGAGPRGRVVRATDPAGRPFRVQTVDLGHGSAGEVEAVLRAAGAPHPRLFQAVTVPQSRCVAFAAPDDLPTLAGRGRQLAAAGAAFPRAELLAVVADLAATLDDLHRRAGFAHGLLNPAAVVTPPGRAGLTGFGVGELLRRTRTELDWIDRDPHAAPEARRGEAVPASDQYSLALIFLECLHAWTPAPRRPGSASDHGVHFGPLRDAELAAVRKALAARPADRHASCAAFAAALAPAPAARRTLDDLRLVEPAARLAGGPGPWPEPPAPGDLIEALLRHAPAPALGPTPARQPDHRWACRLPALLTADLLRLKLDQFRDENALDELAMGTNTLAFRRLPGAARPGVELCVQLPPGSSWGAAEVTVHARSVGGLDSGTQAMPPAVAALFEGLRRAVQGHADRRRHPRRRADLAVTLVPLDDELRLGDPVAARCRDLSAGGLSCASDGPALRGHLFATFPGHAETAPWGLLGEVVRAGRDPLTGQTLLAVRFLS